MLQVLRCVAASFMFRWVAASYLSFVLRMSFGVAEWINQWSHTPGTRQQIPVFRYNKKLKLTRSLCYSMRCFRKSFIQDNLLHKGGVGKWPPPSHIWDTEAENHELQYRSKLLTISIVCAMGVVATWNVQRIWWQSSLPLTAWEMHAEHQDGRIA